MSTRDGFIRVPVVSDAENDLPMFAQVGCAVAIATAPDEVKAALTQSFRPGWASTASHGQSNASPL